MRHGEERRRGIYLNLSWYPSLTFVSIVPCILSCFLCLWSGLGCFLEYFHVTRKDQCDFQQSLSMAEIELRPKIHRPFTTPFQDGTGTLSVTASDSSHALLRLGSIGSIGKSSYFTFLTSNFWLLLFSDFITYILQGTSPHIADDIRWVYLHPYIYTCLFSHRHLSCFHHLGQRLRWVFSHFLLYS